MRPASIQGITVNIAPFWSVLPCDYTVVHLFRQNVSTNVSNQYNVQWWPSDKIVDVTVRTVEKWSMENDQVFSTAKWLSSRGTVVPLK